MMLLWMHSGLVERRDITGMRSCGAPLTQFVEGVVQARCVSSRVVGVVAAFTVPTVNPLRRGALDVLAQLVLTSDGVCHSLQFTVEAACFLVRDATNL